jgi:hypothetical protein
MFYEEKWLSKWMRVERKAKIGQALEQSFRALRVGVPRFRTFLRKDFDGFGGGAGVAGVRRGSTYGVFAANGGWRQPGE